MIELRPKPGNQLPVHILLYRSKPETNTGVVKEEIERLQQALAQSHADKEGDLRRLRETLGKELQQTQLTAHKEFEQNLVQKIEAANQQTAETLHKTISATFEARQQTLDKQLNTKLDGHIKATEEAQKTILSGQNALGERLSNQMAQLFAQLSPQTIDVGACSPPHKQRKGGE